MGKSRKSSPSAVPSPATVLPPLRGNRGGRIAACYARVCSAFIGAERTIAAVAAETGVSERDVRLVLDRARLEGHATPRVAKCTFTLLVNGARK